jgi:hypothetical protein
MHLIDAMVAILLVLSMLAVGMGALKQKALALEDARVNSGEQLALILASDECQLNPKSNCTGERIERLHLHS